MAKAKRTTTQTAAAKRTERALSDAALINDCVEYTQNVAAFSAGFDADNQRAGTLGNHYAKRAATVLAKIARTSAMTSEGVRSKALILPMVLDEAAGGLDDLDDMFLRSLAADVNEFFERSNAVSRVVPS